MPGSWRELWKAKSTIIIILTPLLLLPVPILYTTKAGRCAYGLLIMAIYWMTEALPIAVTALLPIAIFPWLGVAPSKDLCRNYLKDTNMLFLGGLMVALAIEKWNLHRRIALRVLMLVGSRPQWLMFGFMSTTAFLSMWISNTATTAMMIPIAQAVLNQLQLQQMDPEHGIMELHGDSSDPDINKSDQNNSNRSLSHKRNSIVPEVGKQDYKDDRWFKDLQKGVTICVCYAANIGGISTLTGTGPNLVMKGQVDTIYGSSSGINFSSWFIFAFPLSLICLCLAWFWLILLFLGPRELGKTFVRQSKNKGSEVNTVIRDEYNKLGPMSFAEKAVLVHFVSLAVLWITREPDFVPGWSYLFEGHADGYVTDACVALTVSVSLFMFPSRRPNYWIFRRETDTEPPGPAPGLLDWPSMTKFSWGVVLVLGGGFALADACKTSGLSQDISELFGSFNNIPVWVLVLALCVITATFTEVTSNVATATIFLPILAELANMLEINPLYLLIPVTVSTSFAFMLPVATPPNAIAFAYGHLKIVDMVKAGVILNVLCIVILQVAINTWGYAYFRLGQFPAWAGNVTTHTVNNHSAIAALKQTTASFAVPTEAQTDILGFIAM